MLRNFLKGALPAMLGCGFACGALYNVFPLTILAWIALPLWLSISVYRFCQEFRRRSSRGQDAFWDRESFDFWFGATVSTILAPIVYFLVGAHALAATWNP